MGIMDIFTGESGQKGADAIRAAADAARGRVTAAGGAAQEGGLAALQAGQTGALDAWRRGLTMGRGDITGSVDPALKALYGGQTSGVGALQQGQRDALGQLQAGVSRATGAYQPLGDLGRQFTGDLAGTSNIYGGSLGLGGEEGRAAALKAFQAGPGYEWAQAQGAEGLARQANASGLGPSGNALLEAQKYAQGMAQQEYNNWQKSLGAREASLGGLASGALGQYGQGVSGAELTGGTGAANITTGTAGRLSDLYKQTGSEAAGIHGTAGRTLAELASRHAGGEAGTYGSTGQGSADLYKSIFGTTTGFEGKSLDAMTEAEKMRAMATAGASKNLWGGLGNLATFGATGGFNPGSWSQVYGA